MDDDKLRKYVNWLRHKHTNYEKYMSKMYDEDGNQTELRKYLNQLLERIAKDGLNGKETLAKINGMIKRAGYKAPPPPSEKTLGKLALRRQKRREKEERLRNNRAIRAWAAGIKNLNRQIERQEELIHLKYVQIMLHKIGMSNYDLRKKLLPKE